MQNLTYAHHIVLFCNHFTLRNLNCKTKGLDEQKKDHMETTNVVRILLAQFSFQFVVRSLLNNKKQGKSTPWGETTNNPQSIGYKHIVCFLWQHIDSLCNKS